MCDIFASQFVFLITSLTMGILFSRVLRVLVVAKPVILGILPLISLILSLTSPLVSSIFLLVSSTFSSIHDVVHHVSKV